MLVGGGVAVGAAGAAPAPTAPPPVAVGEIVVGFGGFTAVPPGDSDSPTEVTPAGGGVGPTVTIGAAAAAVVVGEATTAVVVGAMVGTAVLAGVVPDGAVDGLTVSADGVPRGGMLVLAAGSVGDGATGDDPSAPPVTPPGPGPAEAAGPAIVGAGVVGVVLLTCASTTARAPIPRTVTMLSPTMSDTRATTLMNDNLSPRSDAGYIGTAGPQVPLATSQTLPDAQSTSEAQVARQLALSLALHASWFGQAAGTVAQLPPPSHVPALSVAPVQLGVPQSVSLFG